MLQRQNRWKISLKLCDIFIYLNPFFTKLYHYIYICLVVQHLLRLHGACWTDYIKLYIVWASTPDFHKKKICELHLLPGNLDPCNLFTIVTLSYCCLHHACQVMVVISLNTPQLCEYVLTDHCQNTGSVNQIKIQITLPFVIILLM